MGTSLSGLTPATTFDGLLKTSDNEPLDGTLKAISTGDGTDTILQLSNSALSIGGNTSVSGGVNTSASNALTIQNSDGTQLLAVRNDGRLLLGTSSNIMYLDGPLLKTWQIDNTYLNANKVGIGVNASGSYPLNVRGSGATSATTSLLVQNSAGTDAFEVKDNQSAYAYGGLYSSITRINYINTYNNAYSVMQTHQGDGNASFHQSLAVGQTTTPTARLHVKGSGDSSATSALLVQNNAETDIFEVKDNEYVEFSSAKWYTYLTSNISFLRKTGAGSMALYIDASNFLQLSSTGVSIGKYNATAKLDIKGSGATSATTALLVQNSAGTDMLKVQDDGISNVWLASSGLKMQRSSACRLEVKGLGDATNIDISPWSGSMSIGGANVNKVSVGSTTPLDSKFSIKGSGNDATTTALLVQNSDGDDMLKVTDDSDVTLSKLVTIRNSSAGLFARAYADGYGAGGPLMWVNGSMNLGSSPSTAAKLSVKGSGATSATTALLVENSAGTDLLSVRDDATVAMANNAFQILSSRLVSYRPAVFGAALLESSAVLQATSTTKGFLPPRMTTTERDAISSPASGLMVYNTTTNKAQCYNGTTWNDLF